MSTVAEKENISIRFAVFDYGGVCGQTALTVAGACNFAGRRGMSMLAMRVTPDALTERSRSRVLGLFMTRTTDDVLLMIDRDICCDKPKALVWLCEQAVHMDAVIGGIYSKKQFNDGWAGASVYDEALAIGDESGPMVEARYIATGCLAIPRSVILRAEEKARKCTSDNLRIVPICEPDMDGGKFIYWHWFKTYLRAAQAPFYVNVPEDYAFCDRLLGCGEKIYLAPQFELGHVGEFVYLPRHGGRAMTHEGVGAIKGDTLRGV